MFLGYSQDDMFHHLRFIKPISSFRSQYAYQNIFFLIAARITEKNNDSNFSNLLKQKLLNPLEMENTTATLEDYLKSSNRAEWIRHLKDGQNITLPEDYPYRDWSYLLAPAGGINSNLKDMLKWISLHANQGIFKGQQIISKENMKRIAKAMIFVDEEFGDENYYALGWGRTEYSPYPIIAHDGATFGAYAFAAFIPEEKLGIVILSNLRVPQVSACAWQFFDQYFNKPDQNRMQITSEEKKPPSKISNPYPAMALLNYEGTYTNPVYGKAIVRKKNEDLEIQIGQKNLKLSLTHWDRDIFTLKWPIVDQTESKVIFIPDDTRKISTMKIEYFAREGSGDFEKIQ